MHVLPVVADFLADFPEINVRLLLSDRNVDLVDDRVDLVGAVTKNSLRIVLDEFEPAPAPVHLIHPARGQMPLKTRRFVDFAVPKLRDAMEALAVQ